MNKKTLTLLLLVSIALLSVAGVKVSKLTRTASFASNDLFIVVTGSTAKVTRHIRARDLAVGLGPWITNSGAGGSATNAQPPSTVLTNLSATGAITNFFPSLVTLNVGLYTPGYINVDGYIDSTGPIGSGGSITSAGDISTDGSLSASGNVTGNTIIASSNRIRAVHFTGGQTTNSFLYVRDGTNLAAGTFGSGLTFAAGTLTASGGGSLATNANQFGASTVLTIADRASLTNINVYGTGAVFFGHATVASNITAQSFIGSGTGVPIIKLQTMMSADNAFAISVRTNWTQTTTNFFEVTNATAGQVLTIHSASASGQLVWTNAAAAGGGGPSTNSPPQILAINSGTGTTNIIINFGALLSTNYVRATLTANAGIIVTNIIDGKEITLEIVQDATGNRTIATSSVGGSPLRFGTDITGFGLSTNGTWLDKIKLHGSGTNAQVVGMLRGYAP